MHLTYEFVKTKRIIFDSARVAQLENADFLLKQQQIALLARRQTLSEYMQEFEVIQDVAAKFAYILANNAGTVSSSKFLASFIVTLS